MTRPDPIPPRPLTDARGDDALIADVNAGPPKSEPAFNALYRRHMSFCTSVARRFTPTPDAADDAVQEAWCDFARMFPGFTLTAKLTTFLYPLVRNRALAIARRERVRRTSQLDDDRATEHAIPDDLTPLAAALADLPDAQREVVLMRIVDGMSTHETATALGTAEGTVKSRLSTALATLRRDPRTRSYFDA